MEWPELKRSVPLAYKSKKLEKCKTLVVSKCRKKLSFLIPSLNVKILKKSWLGG
jgi:hypothetical protein